MQSNQNGRIFRIRVSIAIKNIPPTLHEAQATGASARPERAARGGVAPAGKRRFVVGNPRRNARAHSPEAATDETFHSTGAGNPLDGRGRKVIVADAGLIAAFLTSHEYTQDAEAAMRLDPDWILPPLWRAEVRNVLAKT